MSLPGWFAIIVGLGIIGQWIFSYFTGQIPELKTEPIRICFHLAAEFKIPGNTFIRMDTVTIDYSKRVPGP